MSELSVGTLSGLAANGYVIDVASGSQLTQPGMIIAVKNAIFTGTQTASVAGGANFAVTDLSITHEVANPSNKLIISAFLGVAGTSHGYGTVGIALHDGTGLIGAGDTAGSRTVLTAGGQPSATNDGKVVTMPAATFVHTPGPGSKTYTVRAVNTRNTTYSLYINRSEANDDASYSTRGISALVIQEVAV